MDDEEGCGPGRELADTAHAHDPAARVGGGELTRLTYAQLRQEAARNPGDPAVAERLERARHSLEQLRLRELAAHAVAVSAAAPARRRILSLLVEGPCSPSEIAERAGVDRSTASRLLRELVERGLIASLPDTDDRRRKHYFIVNEATEDHALTRLGITLHGINEVAELRAFDGSNQVPQRPPDQTIAHFLARSLEFAVEDRRTANRLATSSERLRLVVEECDARGLQHLALRARRELATTLRQDHKWEDLRAVLSDLEEFWSGAAEIRSDLVLAAYAHYAYERGLLEIGPSIAERAKSLLAAADAYGDLEKLTDRDPGRYQYDNWRRRRAWTLAGLADNFCKQTELGWAVDRAMDAVSLFRTEGDTYGLAHSLLTKGFCHRLRGQFDDARTALGEALDLATDNRYFRTQANTLVQLGDVARCLDDQAMAMELFYEGRSRAEELGLKRTVGYACLGLGAVEFKADPASGKALELFDEASKSFSSDEVGWALNCQRMAVVLRHRERYEDARDQARRAADSYKRMLSPAGAAACLVTIGHISFDEGTEPVEVLGDLLRLLSHRSHRTLLELDPWFPPLLRELATRTVHEEVREAADALVKDAKARRYEDKDLNMLVLTARDHRRGDKGSNEFQPKGDENHFMIEPDEMAGEPRRVAPGVAA